MFEYYIISFVLYSGEIKEYYIFCDKSDVKKRAKELTRKFFDLEDLMKVDIYKYQKSLDLEEMRKGE